MGPFLGNLETGSEKEQKVPFLKQLQSLSWAHWKLRFNVRGAEESRNADRSGGEGARGFQPLPQLLPHGLLSWAAVICTWNWEGYLEVTHFSGS